MFWVTIARKLCMLHFQVSICFHSKMNKFWFPIHNNTSIKDRVHIFWYFGLYLIVTSSYFVSIFPIQKNYSNSSKYRATALKSSHIISNMCGGAVPRTEQPTLHLINAASARFSISIVSTQNTHANGRFFLHPKKSNGCCYI